MQQVPRPCAKRCAAWYNSAWRDCAYRVYGEIDAEWCILEEELVVSIHEDSDEPFSAYHANGNLRFPLACLGKEGV